MRTRPTGHTLIELLVTSAIVLLMLGLVAAILTISARSGARLDAGVDLQLQAQSWLDRMAGDLAASSRHRFFANRCELDVFSRSELFRFEPGAGYEASSRTLTWEASFPVGTPDEGFETPLAAFNFEKGEVLQASAPGGATVRLRFPSHPSPGDRILVEYPVNHLVVYQREPETGLLTREVRDSAGSTHREFLNPPERRPRALCQTLSFEEPLPRVARIRIGVLGERDSAWQDSLDVSLSR